MKKLLLTVTAFLAFYFNANAQLTFSFEESEGFTEGEIGTQSDFWGTFSDTDPFYVSTDYANDGTQSLKFSAPESQDYAGGYLYFTNPYTNYSISQDLLTNELSSTGNYFQITAGVYASSSFTTASALYLYYGNSSIYAFYGDGDSDYELLGTYDAEDWFNVKLSYDSDSAQITYYINDEEVFTSDFYGGDTTPVNMIQYITGAGDTSWYMDNVVVSDNDAAVVKSNVAAAFSVYPNPAVNVVNVSNATALVNNVALTDLNGRTVKTVKFDGVSNAQVNIADLASGVYMMTITSDTGTATKKIVKN